MPSQCKPQCRVSPWGVGAGLGPASVPASAKRLVAPRGRPAPDPVLACRLCSCRRGAEATVGKPKLPHKRCLSLFSYVRVYCFYCLPVTESRVPPASQSGSKSERIALDADLTLALGPIQNLRCLRTVLLFCLGCGVNPQRNPLQKNQFAAPPALLFLLCWSRYVLFLLLH